MMGSKNRTHSQTRVQPRLLPLLLVLLQHYHSYVPTDDNLFLLLTKLTMPLSQYPISTASTQTTYSPPQNPT